MCIKFKGLIVVAFYFLILLCLLREKANIGEIRLLEFLDICRDFLECMMDTGEVRLQSL